MILLIVALAPAFYLVYYIWKMDTIEKEPAKLLRKLFLMGVVSCIPAALIEMVLEIPISAIFGASNVYVYQLVNAFIGVALVEEGCKLFMAKKIAYNDPAFDYKFDAVVYCVVTSLGFAALENVLYVFENGLGTGLVRALVSVPGHAIFGVFMGLYMGQMKIAEKYGDRAAFKKAKRKTLLLPVLIHGFFDFCLFLDSWIWSLVFIVFIVILDRWAIKKVKTESASDHAI